MATMTAAASACSATIARTFDVPLDLVEYFATLYDDVTSGACDAEVACETIAQCYEAELASAMVEAIRAVAPSSAAAGSTDDDAASDDVLDSPVTLATSTPAAPEATGNANAANNKYGLSGEWGADYDALRRLEKANATRRTAATGSCTLITSAELIAATHVADPVARRLALKELCPCHVRKDVPEFWERVVVMARTDEDAAVRLQALHNLADGSPPRMEDVVVETMALLERDADADVRKAARKVMTSYRHAGKWNVM